MAQADKAKAKVVTESIRVAFSSGSSSMIEMNGSSGGNTINNFNDSSSSGGRPIDLPAGKRNTAADPDPELDEIRELLEETVSLELGATEASPRLELQYDSRGLVVRVAAKDFFDPGQVEVRADLRPVLDRIGKVVSKTNRLMRIEGHTDLGEGIGAGFPSDWELSAARAAWVAQYWIRRFELNPIQVGIAGYAHYHPLSQSQSAWGKGKNRRVELIILNNQYRN